MPCCKFGIGVFISLACMVTAVAMSGADDQSNGKTAAPVFKGDPYTLDICPVSGEKLGSMGKPVVKEYDGREVRFCCNACVSKFEADQENHLKKIDEKLIEQQLSHYPLKTCVVMPEDELNASEHAEPVNYIYKNRLVRFCCKGCIKGFNDEPDKYVAVLNEAVIAQQKDAYPLDTCPVSGEKLGSMGEPVNHVVGINLVKLCCKGCLKQVKDDPAGVLAKVNDGWKAKHDQHDVAHDRKDGSGG